MIAWLSTLKLVLLIIFTLSLYTLSPKPTVSSLLQWLWFQSHPNCSIWNLLWLCTEKKNTVIVPKPMGPSLLKYYKTGTNMMHFTDEICENLNSYNGLFLHIMPWSKIKGFSTTDIWSVSTDHIRDSHSLSRGDCAAAHTWIVMPLAGHCSLCCSRSEGRAAGRNQPFKVRVDF